MRKAKKTPNVQRPTPNVERRTKKPTKVAKIEARSFVWQPCADGLPDSDTTVLVSNPEWIEPVFMGYHDGEVWREINGAAWMPDDFEDPNERPPTHWADLPEPPAIKKGGAR